MHSQPKLQVAELAWSPYFVALLPIPRPSFFPRFSLARRFSPVAVSRKVSPSANRTTNNHKVAALCRNRIPTLGPTMLHTHSHVLLGD